MDDGVNAYYEVLSRRPSKIFRKSIHMCEHLVAHDTSAI